MSTLEDLITIMHDYARIMENEDGVTTESMLVRRTADTLSNIASDKKYITAIREA
jgi:hypothetical protein